MQTEKLSISLPLDMARMIRRQVENGDYASNSEVIRDALRIWQQREEERAERLKMIRAKINEAAENPERLTPEQVRQRLDRLHRRTAGKF